MEAIRLKMKVATMVTLRKYLRHVLADIMRRIRNETEVLPNTKVMMVIGCRI